MGNEVSWFTIRHLTAPHLRGYPDSQVESKYDPLFGFPRGRKVRVMHATEVEMDSAKIQAYFRDYCAHKLIKLKACKRDNKPFYNLCHHFQHAWEECQYEDSVLRMKEYERERRLDARQQRILARMKQGQY